MENFYLESNEELFSIIDRVKRSRDRNIILVIPNGLSALRSVINLKILKEEAISLGKSVSIFTSDILIKKLAQQSGLEVLDREPQKEEILKNKGWPEQLMENDKTRSMSELKIPISHSEPETRVVMSDIVGPTEPIRPHSVEPIEAEEEIIKEPIIEEKLQSKEKIEEPIIFDKPDAQEEVVAEPQYEKDPSLFYKKEKTGLSFKFFKPKRLIAALTILGLIAGGFILFYILPRANIVINPKKETIKFETEIIANKDINSVDKENNSVPAQVFQLEIDSSKKFPTTGEKDVEEKAEGTIMVYNQYSSEPQSLVKTTRFLSEDGKLFRLVETTTIPGATINEGKIIASSKEVNVVADEAGEVYNISPSKFTIPGFKGTPKYTGFYGESQDVMSGGAKGIMRVVTKNDIEGALEIISLELKNKAQEEFNKKIPEELKLLEATQNLEVIESSTSIQADEPGKDFTATVKVRAWGLAFKEDDIFKLVEDSVGNKISENKVLLPLTIKVDYTNIETDSSKGVADLSCKIEATVAWKINNNAIKENLAGKDEIEVRRYLSSLSEIEKAKIVFWPFWVKKIPNNKDKIKIVIDSSL